MSSFGYDLLGFGSSANTAVDLPSDDEFNRVSFLSHFDGANNGVNNAFDDGSASNHTITAAGNVTQGSFGPFARPDGEWGVDFELSDSLAVASSSDFNFGTSNFTWECFVFQKSRSGFQLIMTQDDYSTGNSISCWLTDTGQASIYYQGGGTHFTTTATVPLNTWTHLAWVRKGTGTNEFSIYINGTAEVSGTMTTSFDQDGISIGQQANGDYDFIGNISNIRIVNGSAVYAGNFTAPTGKLTAVTNTKLLTCQSNRFVDNSASAHTVTPSGNPSISAFGPFLTSEVYDPAVNGASAYFDGSGDKLTAPDSADWDFGSGNYTVEFWIYPRTTGILQGLVNHWADFNTTNVAWTFEWHSDGNLQYYIKTNNGTSGCVATGGASIANKWMHVAAARNSNVHTLYLDGVSKATVTDAGTMNNCTDILRVGDYFDNNYPFNGEICDVRVVKGTAVYTGNFTPPTAPLTAITNTKLLLNMADGQAIDSAAQTNLTLIADSKLSNTQAKFGDTSLKSDGTGDYAYIPSISIVGDFTIEGFFYFNANPAGLFDLRDGSKRLDFWYNDTDGTSSVQKGFGGYDTGYFGVDDNTLPAAVATQWLHVAVCRIGSVVKLYHNGTLKVTHTHTNDYPNGNVKIGYGGSVSLNGFVDDVRISNMARYTNNFTAPTAPFADKGQ